MQKKRDIGVVNQNLIVFIFFGIVIIIGYSIANYVFEDDKIEFIKDLSNKICIYESNGTHVYDKLIYNDNHYNIILCKPIENLMNSTDKIDSFYHNYNKIQVVLT